MKTGRLFAVLFVVIYIILRKLLLRQQQQQHAKEMASLFKFWSKFYHRTANLFRKMA